MGVRTESSAQRQASETKAPDAPTRHAGSRPS
ncbi:expressed unknown protein [Ectocarpus siliculosus]|uniref:Uncharacterized protein n=1 Tax=Ectocarpus siliculosus TaxID=2880 RepID=D8LHB9_ECTSI|nr:expressed unknown protein [Ectocarpus siliculosus]|eukprot:CBN74338.1 expressed unknown protein [Ectocarpus siliculosus]